MKRTMFCFICFSFLIHSSAQDPQFTQSFGAMTYNNPAFAGSDTMGTVFITHRNQWPKLSGTYQTTVFGWQQYISDFNSYFGFHYMYDKAAAFTTQRMTFNYSQNIKIKKLLLRPSMEFCYFHKEVDWNQLTFGDMIDPRTGFRYSTNDVPRGGKISNVDFNAGLLANFYNTTIAISIHHLTQPNESLMTGNSPLPMKLSLQFGHFIKFGIKETELKIQPYFIAISQGNFRNLNYGINTEFKNILLGFNFRANDSYAFIVGYSRFNARISYCYEITDSTLGNQNTGGTHEFTMAFKFWKKDAHKKHLEHSSMFY